MLLLLNDLLSIKTGGNVSTCTVQYISQKPKGPARHPGSTAGIPGIPALANTMEGNMVNRRCDHWVNKRSGRVETQERQAGIPKPQKAGRYSGSGFFHQKQKKNIRKPLISTVLLLLLNDLLSLDTDGNVPTVSNKQKK